MLTDDVVLELHTGQSTVFRSKARFRVLVTGRRWGKTTLDKAEAVSEFGTPGLVWYLAPTYDMARELMWDALHSTVPRAWLVKDPNETRMEMETIWGCKFACKSVEHPDRLRGRGPRKVIGDEFQDWKDGWQTWEEVILPSLLTSNGSALLTGTPKSFNHLYKAFEKGQRRETDWESWQFITASAPHISQEFLGRMREQMDSRAFRQEFEASFENLKGRAYYAFSRLSNTRELAFDRLAPVYLFFDFNVDPACGGIGQKVSDCPHVHFATRLTHRGGEATKSVAMAVRKRLQELGHQGEVRIYGDATGKSAKTTGPADHQILREVFPGATWCIRNANPHEKDRVAAVNSVCESMTGVRRLLVDSRYAHPLIEDLEQVIYDDNGELDKKTNPELTHISDAFGYWIVRDFPPVNASRAGAARIEWML